MAIIIKIIIFFILAPLLLSSQKEILGYSLSCFQQPLFFFLYFLSHFHNLLYSCCLGSLFSHYHCNSLLYFDSIHNLEELFKALIPHYYLSCQIKCIFYPNQILSGYMHDLKLLQSLHLLLRILFFSIRLLRQQNNQHRFHFQCALLIEKREQVYHLMLSHLIGDWYQISIILLDYSLDYLSILVLCLPTILEEAVHCISNFLLGIMKLHPCSTSQRRSIPPYKLLLFQDFLSNK